MLILFIIENSNSTLWFEKTLYTNNVYKAIECIVGNFSQRLCSHVNTCVSSVGFAEEVFERSVFKCVSLHIIVNCLLPMARQDGQ